MSLNGLARVGQQVGQHLLLGYHHCYSTPCIYTSEDAAPLKNQRICEDWGVRRTGRTREAPCMKCGPHGESENGYGTLRINPLLSMSALSRGRSVGRAVPSALWRHCATAVLTPDACLTGMSTLSLLSRRQRSRKMQLAPALAYTLQEQGDTRHACHARYSTLRSCCVACGSYIN